MITSWNVNEFCGGEEAAINISYKEKCNIWKVNSSRYIEKIISYLNNKDDIVFINEFKGVKSIVNTLENRYEMASYPIGNNKFVTAAIFSKGAYKLYGEKILDEEFGSFRNRVIAVQRKDDPTQIIFGIHIPTYDPTDKHTSIELWNSIIRVHRRLHEDNRSVIYIGDINTYIPGTVNKSKLYEFMSEGLVDFWIETGHDHNEHTSNFNTRIDYALVTGKDFDKLNKKYDMTVDHTVRVNGLSDHSAIILKERTPETKKTGELK
ncbi:endonuclease/exonuclease/phosphatase family protein [Ruminococcus sp.]|uniref:endonuclease/exonuclease/phosphatase family protein n=1 Tax=Ruminococcus sp. TaxID=41978 RepID=UPI0025838F4A|nr:endonuclease/exonuclease/phosphatase family protein [Ruminococcus sp.]MCR5021671.1 hypothetical protein [Ruminococcus sp.]